MSELTLRSRIGLATKALFSSEPVTDIGGAISQLVAQRRVSGTRTTREMLKAYSEQPWLRSIVHRVSEDVSSSRWKVLAVAGGDEARGRSRYTRRRDIQRAGFTERKRLLKQVADVGELEEVAEHPFRDLVDRSDPTATGKVITGKMRRKLLVEHLELAGDGFWLLERNEGGVPSMAWPIPPHWIQRLPQPDELTFEVAFGSWHGEIPVTEMYWVSDADPENPYGRGKGTAQAVSDELETDEFAAKHTKQTFFNRARPDFVASFGPVMGKPDSQAPGEAALRRKQADWMHQHRSFWRAFRPHFTNREVKIHELGQTFEQLQMVDLRQWQRDVIFQVWGVPAEIMGVTENSNRATSHNARMIYAERVLVPRLELIRETFQELAEREYDSRLVIDYDSPLPEDREFQLDVAKVAPWAFLADEYRELADIAPLEDDDGRVHAVPFNLDLVERLRDAPRPAGETSANGNGHRKLLTAGTEKLSTSSEFYRLIHRIAERLEPEMERRFLEAVEQVRDEVDLTVLEDALRAGRGEAALAELRVGRLAELLGEGGDQELVRVIRQGLEQAGEAAAAELSQVLEVEIAFEGASRHAVAWARDHAADMVTGVTEETERALRALISDALEEGIGSQRTARQIAEQLGDTLGLTAQQASAVESFRERLIASGMEGEELADRVARFRRAKLGQRAERIARNETITAANQGQEELWRQAAGEGLLDTETTVREWIVTPDERLCPICAPMEGQRRKLGNTFESPFDESTTESPPIHVQCRCAVGLVFDAEETD